MSTVENPELAEWQIGSIDNYGKVRVLKGKGYYCNLARALSRPGQNPVIEGARRVFLLNQHPKVKSVVVHGKDDETDAILKSTYQNLQMLDVG